MRTLADVLDQFAYHPATPETAPKFGTLREEVSALAEKVWDLVPDGPEKTLAFRKLQEAQMYFNLAIALSAPADLTHHKVARVMPEEDSIPWVDITPSKDLIAETVERKANLDREQARATNVVQGQCYGPISVQGEGLERRAVCHWGICTWTKERAVDDSVQELQVAHNDAGAALNEA